MTQQSYDEMLEELEKQKAHISKTISASQEIVQEHGEIIKKAQEKLSELENGMQFIRKWFLHEALETDEKGDAPLAISVSDVVTIAEDAKLEDVVLQIIDSQPERKFTARDVETILKERDYPTSAKNFIDVIQNALRTSIRKEKVGVTRRTRPMKFFSLADQRKGETMFDAKN